MFCLFYCYVDKKLLMHLDKYIFQAENLFRFCSAIEPIYYINIIKLNASEFKLSSVEFKGKINEVYEQIDLNE